MSDGVAVDRNGQDVRTGHCCCVSAAVDSIIVNLI
jgi:hypothetical protein